MTNLQIGDKAPYFQGINENGEAVSLGDFKGRIQKIIRLAVPPKRVAFAIAIPNSATKVLSCSV
jgi:hypothetical protein